MIKFIFKFYFFFFFFFFFFCNITEKEQKEQDNKELLKFLFSIIKNDLFLVLFVCIIIFQFINC